MEQINREHLCSGRCVGLAGVVRDNTLAYQQASGGQARNVLPAVFIRNTRSILSSFSTWNKIVLRSNLMGILLD